MNDCYKFLFTTVILLLCLLGTVEAQQLSVSGKVTTDDTSEGLPGASIIEKGTTNGGISDINGSYNVTVSPGATLIFSFVGYLPKEIQVGERSVVDVTLEADVQQLSEIVVIGYGQVQKADLTGAVTALEPKDFNKGAIVSPQALLTGRVAGLQITSAGGAPGAGARVRIRGGSSLNASNDPLVVIDGMPVDNNELSGMRNPLSIVNPNDIESMSVLKDASATAIYGSRASNGVIIITTKRGQVGDKLKLSYNGNVAIHTVPKTVDVLTGDEYRTLVNDRVTSGDLEAPASGLMGTANTDWQNEIFETAIGTDHNISATGAIKDMPYRASIGYTDQSGVLKTSNLKRTSVSIGLDPSFMDDHLKLHVNFKGMFAKNQFPNEGAIGGAVTFDPTQPIRVQGSPWGGYYYWPDGGDPTVPNTIAGANPVAQLNLTNNEAKVNRYLTNAVIDYKFHFLPDLSAKVNLALDKSSTDGLEIIDSQGTWEAYSYGGVGKRNQYEQEKSNELLETSLQYQKELPGTAGKIDLLAGYSWQHFETSKIDSLNNLENSYDRPSLVFKTENYLVSFFGRLNYTLNNKYLFTATVRRDGSSRFAEGNRWGLFPSAAIAWKINEEAFLKSSETVSQLKLRIGYGVTGQQDIGGDYPALARVVTGDNASRYQFGNEYVNTVRYEGYDSDLVWEETTTLNAGLDFGFLNDRITGSIDVYKRETTDLLNSIPVPIGTNFTNFLLTNIGSLENKGIEIAVNGFVIDNQDFSWNLGVNFTHNVNEITDLTAVNDPNYLGILTGGISGGTGNSIQVHSVGHPANSFFVHEQVYDQNGNPIEGLYVDQNDDEVINDLDRVRSETPVPNYLLGFSSRVYYKQFDFSFNARANIGNYVYDNVSAQTAQYSQIYNSSGALNNIGTGISKTNFSNQQFLSDFYLYDASFFRMDNLTVGYRMDRFFSDDVSAYFNFTVQNVFVVTDYHGLDPEVQAARDYIAREDKVGIDSNIYPRPRSFILGVSINF